MASVNNCAQIDRGLGSKTLRGMLFILILLSAMPDTMAAPVVKELFMDRYGATPSAAQMFNGINLLGALIAIPLLWFARKRERSVELVVWGSIADAILLAAMACPLGLGWTLMIRALEGVTDVIVFAALFELVRRLARGHVATGLGLASTPLLLGLGLGAMLGGFVVRQTDGSLTSVWLFGASAVLSLLVALVVPIAGRAICRAETREPITGAQADGGLASAGGADPLWPSLAMTFSDRASGGLITGTLPIALAQVLSYSAMERGLLVGLPLLLMALGTGPAGWLCDRVGSLKVRVAAGIAYATGFALLAVVGNQPLPLGCVMVVIGVSASALFSSSITLVTRCGSTTMSLGAFRGAGDLGFLSGTLLSLFLLSTLGGSDPTYSDYASVLLVFAGFHLVTTITTSVTLHVARRKTTSSACR